MGRATDPYGRLTGGMVRKARFTRRVMAEMVVCLVAAGMILALALVDAIDTHHHHRPPTWDLVLLYGGSLIECIGLVRIAQTNWRRQHPRPGSS